MPTTPSASSPPVVTRFAPSPTGNLHVGGARTAMFCRAFARKHHGSFILRVEDTDAARSSDESARGIMHDLAWLGLTWDEGPEHVYEGKTIGGDPRGVGPFFQARRLAIYNDHVRRLIEMGKAYPAFESAEEIEAERKKAVAAKQTYRYNRASYEKVPQISERLRRIDAGEPHVVRFFAPHEQVVVHDLVLGDVRYAPGELDDFVIRKADGMPTYHFAVVVDDQTMGVTHVMRAQEHLINTPRHVALQRAFGFPAPQYAHMPLIFNMDASKMSKRDRAKAARKALKDKLAASPTDPADLAALAATLRVDAQELTGFLAGENDSTAIANAIATHYRVPLPEIEVCDFRDAGYAPEAITNFLGLLGWNPGMKTPDGKDLEKFDLAFIDQHFSIERIGKTNSKFDRAKLLSFNAATLAALPAAEFARRFRAWCSAHEPAILRRFAGPDAAERFAHLAAAVQPRAKTMRDGAAAASFITLPDDAVPHDAAAVAKHLNAEGGKGRALLREFTLGLEGLSDFSPAQIHGVLESLARAHHFVNDKGAVNVGPIAQPVRIALAGTPVSPPLPECLAALGKEASLTRLRRLAGPE